MNKLSILGTLIPILLLAAPQALADPQHCNSYSECYSVGYGHGYADGQSGYDNVGACHNHSQAYCGGYYQGYRDEVSNNPNIGSQQGESNQVNIHGNNDHVNINQAQNAQSGTSSAAGYSYHDANPRCLLICATVNLYELEQNEKLMKLRELIGLTKEWHIGTKQEKDKIFEDVVGYDDIKKVFRMALKSDEPVHVLLVGPPASAKTIFLEALLHKLGNNQAYFAIGSSSTKAGVLNMLFIKEPKYLMVYEIDKMPASDQASLLGLMETGELVETKVGKTRSIKLKTWVFATANTTTKLSKPLLTRFMVFSLKPYTYEDFEEVTVHLLGRRYNLKMDLAVVIASAVWHKMGTPNIRQCIKIAKMTKKKEDVEWLIETMKKYQDSGEDWNE